MNFGISIFFYLVSILVIVIFYTVFERKLLATLQHRNGPILIWSLGLNQGWIDGFKLFFKETIFIITNSYTIYIIGPCLLFSINLVNWLNIPICGYWLINNYSILLMMVLISFSMYLLLFSGWVTNSQYSWLGSLRSINQLLAYEIFLSLVILNIFMVVKSINLFEIINFQRVLWLCYPILVLVIIFFISILIETNRIPFDLPEAEAELIAGPYTEYSSFLFAFFFLAEYSNMLLNTILYLCLFFGFNNTNFFGYVGVSNFLLLVKFSSIVSLFVIIRGSLPRFRIDQLLLFTWKYIIPCLFMYTVYQFFMIIVFI